MDLTTFLDTHPAILTEAAVIEALAHNDADQLHPDLFNAPMVATQEGRSALLALYQSFYQVAEAHGLPFMITTPTWRASQERILRAGADQDLNETAVAFLRQVIREIKGEKTVVLGGLMGCGNDCYRPDQGLDERSARRFHAWQADRLAGAGADFLLGATLPALAEAKGMARAMADTGIPYMISFVINREGQVLDGTPLGRAVDDLDQTLSVPPAGYMVNCAHPSFLKAEHQPRALFRRLAGFQANASALDHDQLDNAPLQKSDDIGEWADQMIRLNREFGVRILGGCCGTRQDHLARLARGIVPDRFTA